MKELSFFRSSHDEGKQLNTTVFLPEEGEPKAVVVLLHGLAEHFGRYRRFAKALTAEGFALCGHDHLGHGAAVPEGERGFFKNQDGWETVCRDAASLVKAMRKDYPTCPIILMGHSMGSFMARTIYLRSLAPIDGLILSGTGNMSGITVTGGKLVGKWIALWRGKDKVSPLLTSLALGAYDKPFKGEGKNAWISSQKDEIARYNADPLCGFPVKIGMFLDMFDGLSYIFKKKNIRLADKTVPILLVSGKDDPVGDMGKGVTKAYKAFCDVGVQDVSMILYDGCRHEILNDSCREVTERDILAWLSEKT